jgi:threonine dehydrogenase-like Zn-dependent dehydrogenase
MVAARRVDVRQVVSHVIEPRKMSDAFDVALSGDCLKVVIQNGRHD